MPTISAPLAPARAPSAEKREPVSRDAFLTAMRQSASPVCVVTTRFEGQRMALTISSFLSVSADPPLISICINRNSRMCQALTETRMFAVHMLAEDQAHIADTFAGRPRAGEPYDFSCATWVCQGEDCEPLMSGVTASAECAVLSGTDAGSHRLFIAEVKSLAASEKRPLLFWNRLYGFPASAADV